MRKKKAKPRQQAPIIFKDQILSYLETYSIYYLIVSPALGCEVEVGVKTNDDSGAIEQEPGDGQRSPPLAPCAS